MPQTPKTIQLPQRDKVKNDNPIKSVSKINNRPSKTVDLETTTAKAKRKSLPNKMLSVKKAKTKRHSIAHLRSNSGFEENDQ